MEDDKKPSQNWQDIALEASQEKNPERLKDLTEKLLEELDKQDAMKKRHTA